MATKARLVPTLARNWRPGKLSPSSAGIWLNCAGSVAATAPLPEEPAGAAAEEGTRAHLLLEVMFALGLKADQVPESLDDEEVNKAMRKAVAFAKDYVDTWLHEHKGATIHSEHEINIDNIGENVYGTGDVVGRHAKELLVMDFKYGMKKVTAKNNKQMMLYALGELNKYKQPPKHVRLVIVQPRLRSSVGDPIDEWVTTPDELELWADLVAIPIVQQINTLRADAPRTAGDWCTWCRARGTCPALIDFVFKTVGMEF